VPFQRYRSLLGDLRTTYNVHIGLIGKRVVDFLLVLIELFPLTVFTRINFVADFLQAKCNFREKNGRFAFVSPLGGLRGNVR